MDDQRQRDEEPNNADRRYRNEARSSVGAGRGVALAVIGMRLVPTGCRRATIS